MKRLMRFFSMFWCIVLIVTTTSVCQVEATETTWKAPIGASGIDWNTWSWINLQFPEDIMVNLEKVEIEKDSSYAYDPIHVTITAKNINDFSTLEKACIYISDLTDIKYSETGLRYPSVFTSGTWESYPNSGHISYKYHIMRTPLAVEDSSKYLNISYSGFTTVGPVYCYDGKSITFTLYDGFSNIYVSVYPGLKECYDDIYYWDGQARVKYNGTTFVSMDSSLVGVRYDIFMTLKEQGIIQFVNYPTLRYSVLNKRYMVEDIGYKKAIFTDGKIHTYEEINYN